MAEIIRMPRMSDTMTEGILVEWHKNIGDSVEAGDLLAEVETDKATMELESYWEGTLLHIGVQKGEAAQIDQIIAILGENGEDVQAILDEEAAKEPPAVAEEAPASVPAGQPQAAPAPVATPQPAPQTPTTAAAVAAATTGDGRLKASPLAKKMAREKGIDITAVTGTGDGGRVVKRDVETFVPPAATADAPAITLPKVVGEERFEDVRASQMRKTIAARLSESKFGAPHFYLTMEIDMDKAIEARKSINEVAPVKISFNDIIVKATASALRQNPKVNASWLGDAIRYNEHIHIGVAVAIEEGLVVPVIRFTDNKSLSHIAAETRELAGKARDKKLQPEQMQGNTFTISNLGMFDIEEFTAIINPPDACIMAVGRIKETPVVKNGEIKAGNVMKVTLSCDHRAVDGAVGSKFLQTFKNLLEEPVRLLV